MPDVKGNPYRFTLLFNQTDPRHRRTVEILNQQGKSKSQYIVTAILHYIDCNKLPVDSTGKETCPLVTGFDKEFLIYRLIRERSEPNPFASRSRSASEISTVAAGSLTTSCRM